MRVTAAVAGQSRFGHRTSGDAVHLLDRAGTALTALLIDGQGHGAAAASLATLLATRALSMLQDGVRDELVVVALNDFLVRYRQGRVSATVDLVHVDPASATLRLTRQSTVPAFLISERGVEVIAGSAHPIGIREEIDPTQRCWSLESGVRLVVISDGVIHAGGGNANGWDVAQALGKVGEATSVTELAGNLLDLASRRDQGKPRDDQTVLVVGLEDEGPAASGVARHLSASLRCNGERGGR